MDKEEEQIVSLDAQQEVTSQKRGWIFDELMKVGQLEAAMGHNDEQICNIFSDMDDAEDKSTLTKLADELNANIDLIKMDYENRVDSLNAVFDAVPGSDRHYYCQVKHRSTAFVIAAENYHARGCTPDAEASLVKAGKALAMTCSLAFGFEPMSCLRCLDEALAKKS